MKNNDHMKEFDYYFMLFCLKNETANASRESILNTWVYHQLKSISADWVTRRGVNSKWVSSAGITCCFTKTSSHIAL